MSRGPSTGSVLIVVLWSCLGLVSVALLFGHSMLMTYRGADNDLSGRQAEQAIEGIARYAGMLVTGVTHPGEFPDVTTYESDAVPIGEATAWMLGRDTEAAAGTNPVRVYGLVDETGKLNLNTPIPDPTAAAAFLGRLVALRGMSDDLAAAIIDWRDPDDDVQPSGGAESETYQRREPAYACKNADFESIEELALLNGATREVLYGEDTNLNGVLDPNEDDGAKSLPADNADGKLDGGVLDLVTVFSREPVMQSDGITPRVSVATLAPLLPVLAATFDAARVAEMQAALVGATTFTSVLDFAIRSGMKDAEFERISGQLMSGPAGAPRVDLINVDTASEAVLASVGPIGPVLAQQVVAARANRSQRGIGVEWVSSAIGVNALNATPFLTTQTYQVSADAAAVGRHGRGYRRARIVFDATTAKPRIIYRRDLSPLGWALGSEVRQMFAARKERR